MDLTLQPRYGKSHALVIGINDYQKVCPLGYAVQDAEGVYNVLIGKLGFDKNSVTLLKDKDATRQGILDAYTAFCRTGTEPDDRLLVFFAGHGHTEHGPHGDIGYLVPVDSAPSQLSSLICWDELVRNAKLISAKHVFFIMDACYSGLMLMRSVPVGTRRFLEDVLRRHVRQALTAGKADQQVADSGGPRPGHSVFTGHLLDALEGGAYSDDTLTASGVMAYVYDKVSRDQESSQTPHCGILDGDGDFIFVPTSFSKPKEAQEYANNTIFTVSESLSHSGLPHVDQFVAVVKECLAEPRHQIRLEELAIQCTRKYLSESGRSIAPTVLSAPYAEWLLGVLSEYEEVAQELKKFLICVSRWGRGAQNQLIGDTINRASGNLTFQPGLRSLNALRWYPLMVLFYSAGIAAITADDYSALYTLFYSRTPRFDPGEKPDKAFAAISEASLTLERENVFKNIVGHEKYYVPRSEYLCKALQPDIEDLLFLGSTYEDAFDRMEVMLALVAADDFSQKNNFFWGPPGRFAWKYNSRTRHENPLAEIQEEAAQQKENWSPLRAGFFGGDQPRFLEVAQKYTEMVIRIGWH